MSVKVPQERSQSSSEFESPSVPRSLPLWSEDAFRVCIRLSVDANFKPVRWLIINVPASTIYKQLLPIFVSNSLTCITEYIIHHHNIDAKNTVDDERFFRYSLDLDDNGPFASEVPWDSNSVVIGSTIYSVGGRKDFPRGANWIYAGRRPAISNEDSLSYRFQY